MINQKEIDSIVEKITLNIFSKGCDNLNYKILNDLPTTPQQIMTKYKLSKMPTYRRIKILSNLGLINHKKKNGKLEKTELTTFFITIISQFKNVVEIKIPEFIEERI